MESKGSTRNYRSESERRRLVLAYRKSGLSQEAFCKREGLSPSNLYRWSKLEDQESGLGAGSFISINPVETSGWSIELELRSGAVLRFK